MTSSICRCLDRFTMHKPEGVVRGACMNCPCERYQSIEDTPKPARARNSDPYTSQLAAAQLDETAIAGLQKSLYMLLVDVRRRSGGGEVGLTQGELGDILGKQDGAWKRLPELEGKGLIYKNGARRYPGTGRLQAIWVARLPQSEQPKQAGLGLA